MVWLCAEVFVGDAEFMVGSELQQLMAIIIIHITEAKVPKAAWQSVLVWAQSGIKVSQQEDVLQLWYPTNGGIQVLIELVIYHFRWTEHWCRDTQHFYLARWGVESERQCTLWTPCEGFCHGQQAVLDCKSNCMQMWLLRGSPPLVEHVVLLLQQAFCSKPGLL